MINCYPIWKYFIVLLVMIFGVVYAIPNIYGEGFAVYITKHITDKKEFDDTLLSEINTVLMNEKTIKNFILCNTDKILVSFTCKKDQLFAYNKLFKKFSKRYSVSLGATSTTPYWLRVIQAKPVRLGLDLCGGTRFVLRVDKSSILNEFQEQYINTIKSALFEKSIPYSQICVSEDHGVELIFMSIENRNQAFLYLNKIYPDLLLIKNMKKLYVSFPKERITATYNNVIQKNIIILRHRIQQLGIFDPVVQRYGLDGIVIELPGVQDTTRIKDVISTSAFLEFHLVNTSINGLKLNNSFIIPKDSEIKLNQLGEMIPLYKKVILSGHHIIDSKVRFDEYNHPQVNITLDNVGSVIMSNFTKKNIGKTLAILFIEYKDFGKKNIQGDSVLTKCEKVISLATIQSQLDTNFSIVGINNTDEAYHLSLLLRIGALAIPVQIKEEKIVGPTIGKNNIIQGLRAGGLGMLVSIIFMIFWYHYFGLIASVALVMNLMLIISLMSLVPGVMFTMSSIAGIALTLSVAIDANVLINERIKEEMKQGKPIQYSIYIGYRRACISIIDANITTIITSIVLYAFSSSGSIREFAIVTILGVITSMFTSIVGTRAVVNIIYGNNKCSDKISI